MNALFKAKSLGKNCENEYTKRYFSNNEILSYMEYKDKYNLKTYKYNELENYDVPGMINSIYRDENGELSVVFQDIAHCLIVGTTQCGKSWGHLIPGLYALSAKKNKPCFMVTDPKGELMENTAEVLKQRGYKIMALNFKDTQHSNMWNPLLDIYDSWIELKDVEKNLRYHNSLNGLTDHELADSIFCYEIKGDYWSFEGKAYANADDAYAQLNQKKAHIKNRTADLINQFVSSVGTNFIQNSREPIWEQGALAILKGMCYSLLEDILDERSGFTRDNMNFYNMQHYYEIIREGVFTGMVNTPLLRVPKLWHKQKTDLSIRHMKGFLENAANTSRSYAGVFENIMQQWFNPKIYSLTNGNNIDVDNYEDEPFAVFLITRDYEKSDYYIAGLFIDWLYKVMLTKAEKNGGKLTREFYFMLDEFANIPVVNSFTSKISTALSRNIIFQLYVQSYEQIEANYGIADAGTIKANCNVEIFLGSKSDKTKREFSDSCGKKCIKTPDSALSPDKKTIMEIPMLSVNELECLSRGDAYMRRLNKPVQKVRFEMGFCCEEFSHTKLTAKDIGISSPSYTDEIFVYKYLDNDQPMSEYGGKKEENETIMSFIYDPD